MWFDRSRSARARARAPKKSRDNTFARRAHGPKRQTKIVSNGQPFHFTEHKTRMSWKSATQFSLAHMTTRSNVFWEISFFTNSQQKNTGTYQDFCRLQLKEYLQNSAKMPRCFPGSSKKALLLPCTKHLKNTAKKHPHRPQFFLNHFEEYWKNPARYTGAPVQGIPKTEQNRTFTDTPLSPPGSKKHHRRPGFVSNPHPHRPQFFQTHFKEYPGALQNTQVLLYSVSKKLTKQNFYGHTFVTTRQQKTPPQTRICLESPPAQTTIFPDSLQGISRHPAKYTGAPVQRIQKTNKTELLRTHLCRHQAAKNITANHDLSRIPPRNC